MQRTSRARLRGAEALAFVTFVATEAGEGVRPAAGTVPHRVATVKVHAMKWWGRLLGCRHRPTGRVSLRS